MTQTMNAPGQAGGDQSKTEQAGEQLRETKQAAQEKAGQAKGQIASRMRDQVGERSTQAGEQVTSMADALRRTGEQLRGEGRDQPARLTEQAAERAERVGTYLRDSDADRIFSDVEGVARRRPWAVAAGGVVVGFLASRLLKASSTRGASSTDGYGDDEQWAPGSQAALETGSPPMHAGAPGSPSRPGIPDASTPSPAGTGTTPGSTTGI